MVTLQFFSTVSALSHVSEVHSLLFHQGFLHHWEHLPVCQRCMVYRFHQGFLHQGIHFSVCQMCVVHWFNQVSGFLRVSFTSECTFTCFTGAWFTGFFQVSFTREFAIPCVRGACFAASSWFHSPVSVLSRLSEVHRLLVSSGFPLQWVHLPMCQRYTF